MCSVYILYENSLFAHGLERLLREKGVEVIGVGLKNQQALAEIHNRAPDVIIAEVENRMTDAETILSQLLEDQLEAKVVRVSLEDNTATLLTGNRWTAESAEDLLRGIIGSLSTEMERRKPSMHARGHR